MHLSYVGIVALVLHEFFIYCKTAEVLWELFMDLCKPNAERCCELMSQRWISSGTNVSGLSREVHGGGLNEIEGYVMVLQ